MLTVTVFFGCDDRLTPKVSLVPLSLVVRIVLEMFSNASSLSVLVALTTLLATAKYFASPAVTERVMV